MTVMIPPTLPLIIMVHTVATRANFVRGSSVKRTVFSLPEIRPADT